MEVRLLNLSTQYTWLLPWRYLPTLGDLSMPFDGDMLQVIWRLPQEGILMEDPLPKAKTLESYSVASGWSETWPTEEDKPGCW